MYSLGASEIVLGKAIKQFNLPRDEIVVMTKVTSYFRLCKPLAQLLFLNKVYFSQAGFSTTTAGQFPDAYGYVNQHGLSRKVTAYFMMNDVRVTNFEFTSPSLAPSKLA